MAIVRLSISKKLIAANSVTPNSYANLSVVISVLREFELINDMVKNAAILAINAMADPIIGTSLMLTQLHDSSYRL